MKYFLSMSEAVQDAATITNSWITLSGGTAVDLQSALARAAELDAERQKLYPTLSPEEQEKMNGVVYASTSEGAVGMYYRYEYTLQWILLPRPVQAAPAGAGQAVRYCSRCGKPVEAWQKFCMYCGGEI